MELLYLLLLTSDIYYSRSLSGSEPIYVGNLFYNFQKISKNYRVIQFKIHRR